MQVPDKGANALLGHRQNWVFSRTPSMIRLQSRQKCLSRVGASAVLVIKQCGRLGVPRVDTDGGIHGADPRHKESTRVVI
jgi:hypothetical protein